MTDLPKLDLTCYHFEPCKRTDKFPCNNCRDKWIILAHAAAYLKDVVIWSNEAVTEVTSLRNVYYNLGRAEGARDAVLELAGLTPKDLEGGGE